MSSCISAIVVTHDRNGNDTRTELFGKTGTQFKFDGNFSSGDSNRRNISTGVLCKNKTSCKEK